MFISVFTKCISADKLLSGETNLCLTTSSLSVLAVNFRRFSENAGNTGEDETPGSSGRRSKKKDEIDLKTWQENIRTLMDFVWKVKALKVRKHDKYFWCIHISFIFSTGQVFMTTSVDVLKFKWQ